MNIICIILVMLIALIFGFHKVKQKKKKKKPINLIATYDSLLKPNENVLYLKQIVTGIEKSILYNNVE